MPHLIPMSSVLISMPPSFHAPTFRSVAVAPHLINRRRLHFEPTLKRADPGPARHLSPLSPPTRGVSEPELVKTLDAKLEINDSRPYLKRGSASESSLARRWHVDPAALPARPDDLPSLGRTSRLVQGAAAGDISARISERLQERSIRARFGSKDCPDGGNHVAKCRNVHHCRFVVRLYRAAGGVLVEVQRSCGDGVSFMRDCRAILDAAEGVDAESSVDAHEEKPLFLTLPVSSMSFAGELPDLTPEDHAACVCTTARLLASPQVDSNMLGMESLASQTDATSTSRSTALVASRRVLCPDAEGNSDFNVHHHVMSLCLHGAGFPHSSGFEDTALDDYADRLRNLAMRALSNSLALLSAEDGGALLSCLSPNLEWYSSVLVPRLVDDLSRAEEHPHDSCYAARSLAALGGCHADLSRKMEEADLRRAARSAEETGRKEFALLAREVGSMQVKLTRVM